VEVLQRAYRRLRPLWFQMEPERAHHFNMALLKIVAPWIGAPVASPWLRRKVGGVAMVHPVGLAAGFDKNGRWVDVLARLGFAFIEVGAVTPRPQPGNPRPRMWRFSQHQALLNRMGFNNEGADAVLRHLEKQQRPIPVGVNIGKNKDTPHSRAAEDYAAVALRLAPAADFFTVNVSSPNTPGLRELQKGDFLTRILTTVQEALAGYAGRVPPLWLKISPDLSEKELEVIASVCVEAGVRAVVATNTTVHYGVVPVGGRSGGLSGAPLRGRAARVRKRLRALLPASVDVVASGGLMNPVDIVQALQGGSRAAEVFTGLVYYGPALVGHTLALLENALKEGRIEGAGNP